MRHAKIFSIVVFVTVLAYGAVGFYALPLATFQGDLTRIGLLPETLFGWRKPQPDIDPHLMQQASMKEADVLVIGDSFSDTRVWQTVLTKSGLKVRSESWSSMQAVCADIVPWLRAQGFGGKYLVIETIERDMVARLSKSVACPHMQYHPVSKADAASKPPIVSFDTTHGDYLGKISTGLKSLLNVFWYERLRDKADFKNLLIQKDVRIARVNEGCQLFSHVRCEDALFLSYDSAQAVDRSALHNVEILNARLDGVIPIWAFVPNKSTSYLYRDKRFWGDVETHFRAPNLMRMTQLAIQKKTVDLYPANNTHFSTEGYLLMGNEIFQTIQQKQKDLSK